MNLSLNKSTKAFHTTFMEPPLSIPLDLAKNGIGTKSTFRFCLNKRMIISKSLVTDFEINSVG